MRAFHQRISGARSAAGFTLAEVAVTILIVGGALTLLVQGLNNAKFEAAYTRNLKVARELAVTTLGEIAGGVYAEDLENDDRIDGTYADFGYEQFSFEVLIGTDNEFTDADDAYDNDDTRLPYDTVRARREREDEERDDEDEDEVEEPYETVRIRVQFPQIKEYKCELELEQWMEWSLIHGSPEDESGAAGGLTGAATAGDDR
ncbi:MAG: type II secretion system protein [Planctomycetota bacterium]